MSGLTPNLWQGTFQPAVFAPESEGLTPQGVGSWGHRQDLIMELKRYRFYTTPIPK